ncbi:MAG: hypothetical protein ACREDR_20305 [Blastocatellia bacterium]
MPGAENLRRSKTVGGPFAAVVDVGAEELQPESNNLTGLAGLKIIRAVIDNDVFALCES